MERSKLTGKYSYESKRKVKIKKYLELFLCESASAIN